MTLGPASSCEQMRSFEKTLEIRGISERPGSIPAASTISAPGATGKHSSKHRGATLLATQTNQERSPERRYAVVRGAKPRWRLLPTPYLLLPLEALA